MPISAVQSTPVQPKANTAMNKANQVFRTFSEVQKINTQVLTQGREEKNGMLALGSIASVGLGVLTTLKSAATKAQKHTSALVSSIIGASLVVFGAGLAIYNMIDARKNIQKPEATKEPSQEITPEQQIPQALAQEQPQAQAQQAVEIPAAPVVPTAPEAPAIAQKFSAFDNKLNNLPI